MSEREGVTSWEYGSSRGLHIVDICLNVFVSDRPSQEDSAAPDSKMLPSSSIGSIL